MNKPARSAAQVFQIGILAVAGFLLLAANLPGARAHGPIVQGVDMMPVSTTSQITQPIVRATASGQPISVESEGAKSVDEPVSVDNLIGGNFRINTAANVESRPAVAWNSTTNEYLVVSSSHPTIFGQRVRGSGGLVATNFEIGTGKAPAVALDAASNEYLVVWMDYRDSTSYNIYGQRIRGDGTLLGGNFSISAAIDDQEDPAVAWNATVNEYLVVWADARRGPRYIYGQRVRNDGVMLGGNFILSAMVGYQGYPAVAWNAIANEYLTVWSDARNGPKDVYGQRIGSGGVLVGENFAISTTVHLGGQPTVTWNAAHNEYLVVWEDDRNFYHSLYGQRVGSNGMLVDDNFAISPSSYRQTGPAVAWNATVDGYLVTWEEADQSGRNIFGLRVRGDGTLAGDRFLITTSSWRQYSPAVAWNATRNEYLVAWLNQLNGNFIHLYGQRVAGALAILTPTPTRTSTPTPTPTPTPTTRIQYLPLLLRRYPPIPTAPVLDAINPPGANPSYAIRWNATLFATSYLVQRASDASFADATQVYAGTGTSTAIASQGITRYYYRVKARNQWGEGPWSNVQSVEVRWEQEPNYPLAQANGPLRSGLDYYGYPNDQNDYFFFQVASRGQVTIDLTNHTGMGLQLMLRTSTGALLAQVSTRPYHLVRTVDPGRYYVQLFATDNFNTTTPYTLRAVFP